MSRSVSLLALLCGFGVFVLLISLARTDLTGVPADSSSSDLRQSVSRTSALAKTQVDKRQLLAFIGVQVRMHASSPVASHSKLSHTPQRIVQMTDWLYHKHRGQV